ncbi:SDR family NAD(P)-dependent oxidoreductase [Sphingomonas sp.]|uniref:SDR family NAD(P)-dependent oxidoreductase n=1 Tax=Sphingomonas sp. TaxID=28214 RepID=UPI003B3A731A
MRRFVLFGPGYAGSHIAQRLARDGWQVDAFGRHADPEVVATALARADAVLSTVAPEAGRDAVLDSHAPAIGRVGWIGYLSSTGVYGDTNGAWVDEDAPLRGRRSDRIAADQAWLALGARVFRLPGIYGPGRSVIDRLRAGTARRVDAPGQVFSRVHADDIAGAVAAALGQGPAGAYNIADDAPAAQEALLLWAAARLGLPPPPCVAMDDPALSPAARAFYGENRRVANGRARRLLGWRAVYPTWRAGLAALL